MTFNRQTLRKAVPNALTLGNGLCGIGGLILLSGDRLDKARIAAALIFAGWLFDMVDGIAARRLGTAGPFGAALDSLSDAVTFGALPAALLCADRGDVATVACALAFASGALLRLARYMAFASQHDGERWYFEGLPSPAAAMMLAAAAILHLPVWQGRVIALTAAAAMVSRLPYADLPHFCLTRRWGWASAVLPVIAAAAFGVGQVTASVLGLYLLSGPVVYIARRRKATGMGRV